MGEPTAWPAGAGGLVLASGSPRRQALLSSLGIAFTVVVPEIDETPWSGEEAVPYVERLAHAKATAVMSALSALSTDGSPGRGPGWGPVVVAADTTVEVDGAILGKPVDGLDAARMLGLLGGRTHRVHTGLAVVSGGRRVAAVETTEVSFAELSELDIGWYVATGEPMDKAGAYAIQGAGGQFVTRIEGSPSNVVGLPLSVLVGLFDDLGLARRPWRSPTGASWPSPADGGD